MSTAGRLRVRRNVLHRPVADEVVVFDLDSQLVHGLDGVAAFVWQRLADEPTLVELTAAVVERFAVDEATATADLERFVAELGAAGLVETV